MTEEKKRDPDTLQDGEQFDVENGHFFIGCCDCGLVHHYTVYEPVKTEDGEALKPLTSKLIFRVFRDDYATDYLRKGKKTPK